MTTPKGEHPIQRLAIGPNWVITILPFMEFDWLYKEFDLHADISLDPNSEERGARPHRSTRCFARRTTFGIPLLIFPGRPAQRNGTAPWARGNYAANSAIAYLDVYGSQVRAASMTHSSRARVRPGFARRGPAA